MTNQNFNNRNSSVSFSNTSDSLLLKWVRLLLWLHRVRVISPYIELMDTILTLRKNSGSKMCVQFLKTAHLILAHYISGNSVRSKGGDTPRVATKRGIPLIIPSSLRQLITDRDSGVIKTVFCILSVYRILTYPGQLKLSTITDPFKGLSGLVPKEEFQDVYNRLFKPIRGFNPVGLDSLLILRTAGPNHKTSILGAPLDALAIMQSGWALGPLSTLSRYFNGSIHSLLNREIDLVSALTSKKPLLLGKLSTKDEPAGKIRVFAIVDVWTQSVLKPIHDHMFNILKHIDQDGTFDQLRPVEQLLDKIRMRPDRFVASYDLSAATDRFPISIQHQLLSSIYTTEIADSWRDLLINRDYRFNGNEDYRYSCGQPMGALSSWPVFALSHHYIVQLCASRLGHNQWFTDYALLGDDIVIADRAVALSYHDFMTRTLGVDINLSKSIQSDIGVLEFAKRLVSPYCDYSPIGPKNLWLSLTTPSTIPSLFVDGLGKGLTYEPSEISEMLKLLPSILRISKGKLEQLLYSLIGPFGVLKDSLQFGPSRVETPWTWSSKRPVTPKRVALLDAIDLTFIDMLENKRHSAIVKSSISISEIRDKVLVDGFIEAIAPQNLPSYTCLYLKSLEDYSNLFNTKYYDFTIDMTDVHLLSSLVYRKIQVLPVYSPVSGLSNKVEQKPRFRRIGIDFFLSVSRLSKSLTQKWLLMKSRQTLWEMTGIRLR